MGYAILQITDCEHPPVILQSGGETGFHVTAWLPANPAIKGGGVWQDSPLSDGRRLAYAKRQNVRESLTVDVSGVSQDVVAAFLQDLKIMLDRAREYWLGSAQIKPVYLMAKSICETETRYAIIHDWSIPNDDFPYNEPFESTPPAMENITIEIERGNWLDTTHLDAAVNSCVHIGSPAVYDASVGATLLTNGGFENPGAGAPDLWANWTEAGTCRNLTTEITDMVEPSAYAGSYSAVVTTVNGQQGSVSQTFPTMAGQRYRVEFYHFELDCDECGYIPGVVSISEAGLPTLLFTANIDNPGPYWKRYTFEFVPVMGAIVTIQLLSPAGKDGSVAYDEVSVKLVTSYTVGEVSECNNETHVVNHTQRAQLTHVYYYDASVPAFSANIAYPAAFPQALFPAAVAVGDILYVGIAAAALQSGPFDNVIFDLDLNGSSGYTVAWEYWNGAWVALTTLDETFAAVRSFTRPGVCMVSFNRPSGWATTAINGVNAWWIRARVTAVGANINPVRQQNQYIYTATNPFFEIADGEIGGDMDALGAILAGGGLAGIDTAYIGSRAYDRGKNFNAHINITTVQNPPGITCTPGVNTLATNTPLAPTGQLFVYTPLGAEALAMRAQIDMSADLVPDYIGRYRLLLYARASAVGNFTVQAQLFDISAPQVIWVSSLITIQPNIGTSLIDFGIFDFYGAEIANSAHTSKRISIYASALAGGGGQTLDLYSIVLLPIDEWAIYVSNPGYFLAAGVSNKYKLDSISQPKRVLDAYSLFGLERAVLINVPNINNGALQLSRRKTRYWYAMGRWNVAIFNKLLTSPEYISRVMVKKLQQYNSLRGGR